MKKKIISVALLCVIVLLAFVSCTPKAKKYVGKTYVVDDVEIRLNENLNQTRRKEVVLKLKRTYKDESVTEKELLKILEEQQKEKLSKISYAFGKDGEGTYTFVKEEDDIIEKTFKYEVKGKDGFLVLWFDGEGDEKVEQAFEIDGNKLIVKESDSGVVMTITFKKSK